MRMLPIVIAAVALAGAASAAVAKQPHGPGAPVGRSYGEPPAPEGHGQARSRVQRVAPRASHAHHRRHRRRHH